MKSGRLLVCGLFFSASLFAQLPRPGGPSSGSGGGASLQLQTEDLTNRREVLTRAGMEFDGVTAPGAPVATLIVTAASPGPDAGSHQYCMTYVTAQGETDCLNSSNVVTNDGTHTRTTVSGLGATCPTGATGKNLYRSCAGCGRTEQLMPTTPQPLACATTSITDDLADSSLGVYASLLNTTAGAHYYGSSINGIFSNLTRLGNSAGDFEALGYAPDTWVDIGVKSTVPNTDPLQPYPTSIYLNSTLTANANTTDYLNTGLNAESDLFGTGDVYNHTAMSLFALKASNGNLSQLTSLSITTSAGGSGGTVARADGIRFRFSGGEVTNGSAIHLRSPEVGGSGVTNWRAIEIDDQVDAGITNAWAIKTGLGKVEWGDIDRHVNTSGNPNGLSCTSAVYGATYFNTTDKRLCVCVNDGTDDAWVKSSDYTHATGHCTP